MSNMNKLDEDRQIVEESPTMRSVSMLHSMAPPIPLRGPHGVMKPQKQSFRPEEATRPFVAESKISHYVVAVESAPWKVAAPLAIPSYYPLERTHVYVPDASSLEVSKRISDCFFELSIAATFDDKEAIAKAETSDCLKFAVRLWESMGQVVAEVQRTSGCCFLFQQSAKAVLCAAKYGRVDSAHRSRPVARSMPQCVPETPPLEWEACTLEGLEIACNALKPGNRYDAHMLAMNSLVQLTEASKCREFCVKHILCKDSELLSNIISLIQTSRISLSDETDVGGDEGLVQDYYNVMHRHALCILANCLQLGVKSDNFSSIIDSLPHLTCDSTLSSLVQDLSFASTKPHDAAAACRCLQALCQNDNVKQLAMRFDIVGHVKAAQLCRHVVLREECTLLLQEL